MLQTYHDFKKIIWDYYRQHARIFDWRHNEDPYKIFISEIMLQQTQTVRVAQKYPPFVTVFPDFKTLASASLKEVLTLWQGLGYNRRGMYLHQAASIIMQDHQGILPNDPEILVTLPGIGKATAASVCAFAFNAPTVFIETNIRTVFIHFFFKDKEKVHDQEIVPLVAQTLDLQNPKEWYYALMDYGVMLKKAVKNPSRKSQHHNMQSKFLGSDRQIRGQILKLLLQNSDPISKEELIQLLCTTEQRAQKIITQLLLEKLICLQDVGFAISDGR